MVVYNINQPFIFSKTIFMIRETNRILLEANIPACLRGSLPAIVGIKAYNVELSRLI